MKYVNETEEKDVASNPEFFWTRPSHGIELGDLHYSCNANNLWNSDMYFNTDLQFEMLKRGKDNMDVILGKYKLQNIFSLLSVSDEFVLFTPITSRSSLFLSQL